MGIIVYLRILTKLEVDMDNGLVVPYKRYKDTLSMVLLLGYIGVVSTNIGMMIYDLMRKDEIK